LPFWELHFFSKIDYTQTMRKLRFWFPVVIWMAVIFVFSSRQKVALTESYIVSFLFFKTLHLVEYCILYGVTYRALRNTIQKQNASWILAFIIISLYAVTDEVHQRFVPTREGTVRDAIIDMFAGGFAWIYLRYILPKAPKKLRKLARSWQIVS
jgi:VanZ family protein